MVTSFYNVFFYIKCLWRKNKSKNLFDNKFLCACGIKCWLKCQYCEMKRIDFWCSKKAIFYAINIFENFFLVKGRWWWNGQKCIFEKGKRISFVGSVVILYLTRFLTDYKICLLAAFQFFVKKIYFCILFAILNTCQVNAFI